MSEPHSPRVDQLDLATVLNALGDPIRLEILKTIDSLGESTCATCSGGMAKSAVSHHYKVLREAGIIRVRVEGTHRFLTIRKDDLDERFPGLIDSVLGGF